MVVAAALAVVAAAVATAGRGSPAERSPVARAYPFTLAPVLDGAAPASLAAPPGHPVVLAFFASWCAPCRRELPLLEHLSRRDTAVSVVGVDELDQKPDGPDMVHQLGVTFPSGYDHDGDVGRRWAVNGLPITVFIAPDGRVVDYHRGELRPAELTRLVGRLAPARR